MRIRYSYRCVACHTYNEGIYEPGPRELVCKRCKVIMKKINGDWSISIRGYEVFHEEYIED